MIAGTVYILCALTMTTCAGLLLRAYRRNRVSLLLWSGVCFVFLALSNTLIFVDLIIMRDTDLHVWRLLGTSLGMASLLYGLIWESN